MACVLTVLCEWCCNSHFSSVVHLGAGVKGKKIAELYVSADNLLNKAYQNHLSRLKYADMNVVTGRRGVYNMGRNITFKVVVPIAL